MIRQVEQYHGAALARLVRGAAAIALALRAHKSIRSAYVVNERISLYIKYSTNRLSPWSFSFSVEHQLEMRTLRDESATVFVVLVCGTDGIACLSAMEYARMLDEDVRASEWIRVSRAARQKYAVTGSDNRRVFRVGDNEYPAKVYEAAGRMSSLG